MSNRSGFLEGLIVGALLGGLSILVASPNSRRQIQSKFQNFRDNNEDIIVATKESTEDLIEKTKQSIENGFDRLSEIIQENQKVNAEDLFTNSTDKK
ncbi:MAG: YtxH domain-containing protein [Candidatus Margulisiibacteriota bacterium]